MSIFDEERGMLDSIDERILCELRVNSKVPVTTIAKIVGRSRTAVQARINQLEASGKIKQYTIAESDRAEAPEFGAIILVTVDVISRSDNLINTIRQISDVISCHGISGSSSYALFIRRSGSDNLAKISRRLYKLDGVTKTETIISLEKVF